MSSSEDDDMPLRTKRKTYSGTKRISTPMYNPSDTDSDFIPMFKAQKTRRNKIQSDSDEDFDPASDPSSIPSLAPPKKKRRKLVQEEEDSSDSEAILAAPKRRKSASKPRKPKRKTKVMKASKSKKKKTTKKKTKTKKAKNATPKRVRKTYEMPGQKKDIPHMLDGLRIFYESLRKQKPHSLMAETWLLAYGLLPKDEAKKIVRSGSQVAKIKEKMDKERKKEEKERKKSKAKTPKTHEGKSSKKRKRTLHSNSPQVKKKQKNRT